MVLLIRAGLSVSISKLTISINELLLLQMEMLTALTQRKSWESLTEENERDGAFHRGISPHSNDKSESLLFFFVETLERFGLLWQDLCVGERLTFTVVRLAYPMRIRMIAAIKQSFFHITSYWTASGGQLYSLKGSSPEAEVQYAGR